jgi:uroporphyrinogen III methyltransferase/synthase
VVNTRARHQASDLDAMLAAAGAESVSFPCIAIAPPNAAAEFEAAVTHLVAGGFNWIAFTSANAVLAVVRELERHDLRRGAGLTVKVAAIGTATADAIAGHFGAMPAVVAETQSAAGLADTAWIRPGESVLLPVSDLARPVLQTALAARGALVTAVQAYRTVLGTGGEDVPRMLIRGEIDAVAFTSPSTVTGFVARHLRESGRRPVLNGVVVACIGGTTVTAARDNGFNQALAAEPHSLDGLLTALQTAFSPSISGERSWPSR